MVRAVQVQRHGPPEDLVLVDVPRRPIGPGEVRIAVEAACVNFADSLIITGSYQHKPPLPFTPGMEACGTVLEVGAAVRDFAPGARVCGYARFGCFAEEAIFPSAHLFAAPPGLSARLAAAVPIAYGTSYVGLVHRAQLKRGETLLVLGAAGGVGLAAVEIGKLQGAIVIAAASSPEKLALASERGADHVIDYTRQDLKSTVKALTGGADVVFDPVGGDAFRAALGCINWEGRILSLGFAGGTIPQIPANHLLVKNATVHGFAWSTYRDQRPDINAAAFAEISRHLAAGRLKPHVSRVLPLEQTGEGIRILMRREALGRVVIEPHQGAPRP